ncbi:hypothetical protein IWQ62_000051 [Dispira parvispora]|uniref:Uncharacterized protein n=1 Tax=Dispira parvispora TaxID=1520584 RepID=A0A9W8E5E7_9FUNG|nr:hypothetical protein IWQ62_000051 [Dispira parvispora]
MDGRYNYAFMRNLGQHQVVDHAWQSDLLPDEPIQSPLPNTCFGSELSDLPHATSTTGDSEWSWRDSELNPIIEGTATGMLRRTH